MSQSLKYKFIRQLSHIDKKDWQKIVNTDYPFIQYDFLKVLEESEATCAATGWQPNHLTIWLNNKLVGLVPLYLKRHSYGEYVFDFQWADAYHQAGLQYYPKLVTAIPFTPASGPRLFLLGELDLAPLLEGVVAAIQAFALESQASSWHVLFPVEGVSEILNSNKVVTRLGIQYHWFNRGYDSFDSFLFSCKAKKRKNIRRERAAIDQQNIEIKTFQGDKITPEIWQRFFLFYQLTYARRSGHGGYLNELFFQLIGKVMTNSIVLIGAFLNDELIAASLFFKDKDTLYGRYWGCSRDVEFLHFELCYYQGIEYCIQHGLKKFDAGAQGEHKVPRGFEPVITYSNHWIAEPRFAQAIGSFVEQEARIVKGIMQEAAQNLPFKL